MDKDQISNAIREYSFKPSPYRPTLLFSDAGLDGVRQRARNEAGLLDRVTDACDELLSTNASHADQLQAYVSGYEAVTMANGFVLTGKETYAEWAKERLGAQLELETWFAPVHEGGCRVFDHCMANCSAYAAITHDYLGTRFSAQETDLIAGRMREMFLDPFLDGTGEDPEWWFRSSSESNWKIMTCGDSGLALLGFLNRWPEANEALARAAHGVIETLDQVAPEGDWPEGVNYWFSTLFLGLRFARALRRVSDGALDLFEHPSLKATGDFATQLSTPSGAIYNFNDNSPKFGGSEALAMLAIEHRRKDWMRVARRNTADTALFLACDDASLDSGSPDGLLASFPRSGVATMRTSWSDDATFVGFKSGPSNVGHSHLDANSFVIEAAGQPLVIEHPYWPQAHFLGFFDSNRYRWNFDGPGTVGHSTLLIDGQGQSYGSEFPGRIAATHEDEHCSSISGDASECYGSLVRKFIRTILLMPNTLVVRDVLECEGERHVEWLLHYAGDVRSDGIISMIENNSAVLSVTPFLPDRSMGWRISDTERTSIYEHSDTLNEVTRSVRYRSFSTFRKAREFEFLFGFRINSGSGADDWDFQTVDDSWSLLARDSGLMIRPDGDYLRASPAT
ncbi:MAG: heparinase II/III family protein [Planctomycetota bacterium]|jgi:hypothetical protein|nr:heparinase II/III family protein [Planctomycetota bacterium]MDP7254017.1 heparinase II/III family protein [Planctomycetota bacterium]